MEALRTTLGLSDAQLARTMLERKLLGPAKLKAAVDYQASVGGRIHDILVKLGLVKEADLRAFLQRLAAGEDFVWQSGDAKRPVPCPTDVSRLRVHRKLLEKVPPELVRRYGILFFFPPPGTRSILMSSEPVVAPQGVLKLQDLLCVDITTITLSSDDRGRFLPEPEGGRRETPSVAEREGMAAAPSASESTPSSEPELETASAGSGTEGADEVRELAPGPEGSTAGEPPSGDRNEKAAVLPSPAAEPLSLSRRHGSSSATEGIQTPGGSSSSAADPTRVPRSLDRPKSKSEHPEGYEGTPRRSPSFRATASHVIEEDPCSIATLVQLFLKKGLITPEELQVEIALRERKREPRPAEVPDVGG